MDWWYRDAARLPTALDTEFDPDGKTVLMSLSWDSYKVRIVVIGELIAEFFGSHISHKKTRLVYQNYGADANELYKLGIDPDVSFHADTMVMGWLHDETLINHGLKHQSGHFLHWHRKEYDQLFHYVPVGKSKKVVMTPSQVMYNVPDDALNVLSQEEWRERMKEYSGDDAASTKGLYVKHRKYLEQIGYWQNYQHIDREFTKTLMRCEDRGVRIDMVRLEAIRRLVGRRIMRAVHSFRAITQKPELNLNSGPQMQALLIGELGWPTREDLMTKGGKKSPPQPKLDKEALTWYSDEHGFVLADIKLRYNGERTKEATFLKGIVTGVSKDGRLRSHFNQIGADTGRISSRKQRKKITIVYFLKNGEKRLREKFVKVGANLQNIPSRKEKDPDGIRGAFVAPDKGHVTARGFKAREKNVLIVADYSGFELCMMIYWTFIIGVVNPKMLGIMQNYKSPSACHAFTAIQMYNNDIHTCDDRCVAKDSKWLHDKAKVGKRIKMQDISMDDWKLVKKLFPDQYTLSKNNNFNLLYGGSPQMMARLRGLDYRNQDVLDDCQLEADKWNDTYPEVVEYQRFMVDHGREFGWVPTISGRRANVLELLDSDDKGQVGHGERKCMNTPCQGSAADIVKVAMNLIENDEELASYQTGAMFKIRKGRRVIKRIRHVPAVSLLFPVHDEIITECPERYHDPVMKRVLHLMKLPFSKKNVPEYGFTPHGILPFELDVEGKCAVDWLSAKG